MSTVVSHTSLYLLFGASLKRIDYKRKISNDTGKW
ncbi:hypothetical protein OOU_Y34scaffold00773g14 [Pyricularia oryzae Y34]|uniref:Uncharacterized protein n=2 Tax=Pyricularia oryzae TaxID=318829 RepID=A0AA97NQ77_PYRO3|nr:hypothetical protein OOU_Y34scaffold00773g14 [Pyricularia oryzae Y34]